MDTADGSQRAEGWTAAVRRRVRLGRLLPLGGPDDGAWIAERAAVAVLREAVAGAWPAPVLGELRLSVADPEAAPAPGVEPPPSALPPGPLRIEGTLAAPADRPLPASADALRAALLTAARERLGLRVAEVDLRVTELLDEAPGRVAPEPVEVRGVPARSAAERAAAGVTGVAALTGVLGPAVHTGGGSVRVELAVEGGGRTLDVTRAVRAAVGAAVDGAPPVAVLVTAVAPGADTGGPGPV
ncbi:hypothetical protein [Streptomyces sp. NPDC057682]|uniref:hypothetical protein n=1 Tax=Streptomyces sp. NPDC057682 TaxID=3346210 RepID=UPI003692196F